MPSDIYNYIVYTAPNTAQQLDFRGRGLLKVHAPYRAFPAGVGVIKLDKFGEVADPQELFFAKSPRESSTFIRRRLGLDYIRARKRCFYKNHPGIAGSDQALAAS